MDKTIATWAPGVFVDTSSKFHAMSESWKATQRALESTMIRPYPTGNAIGAGTDPAAAAWIAERLNIASNLERLIVEFARGRSDGSELTEYVARMKI